MDGNGGGTTDAGAPLPGTRLAADANVQTLIYLDHQATTPTDPRVLEAMVAAMVSNFGNANSRDHQIGQAAATAVESARASVASLVGAAPEDIHFTSGATDAIQLAFAHAVGSAFDKPLRVALTKIEHAAVLDTAILLQKRGFATISWINVDGAGQVDLKSVEQILQAGVDLICLMGAHNEIGTIYPTAALVDLARRYGAASLVDATQSAGWVSSKSALADYTVISAHKLCGPKGIGALVAPRFEYGALYGLAGSHRPTPNVPAIVGFGMACQIVEAEADEDGRRLRLLRDKLQHRLAAALPGLLVNGDAVNRLPHSLHIALPDIDSDLVVALLSRSVAVSTGAACNSGAEGPSYVLREIGLPRRYLDGALRISLGRQTTEIDIESAADAIIAAIHEAA